MADARLCFVLPSAYGYFAPDGGPVGGGAQRQLSLLARELTDDFDVHFVVGDYGQPAREVRDGVVLHRSYRPDSGSAGLRQPIELARLLGAMRRADADIYVYRGRPWKAAFVYLAVRLLRKRFVYNVANDPNLTTQPAALSAPVRWLFRRALEDASAVVAQTDRQVSLLRSEYGVEGVRVPNGYPPAEDVRPQDEREHVLWVGRLDERQKRPHRYLDLAERVSDVEFLLVGPDGGDDAYNRRIHDRAASLSNVTDLGTVPPDEIHVCYRDALALVNTSAYEGFPNTFLEAWRYETPVVSYEIDPGRFVEGAIGGCVDGNFDRLVELTEAVATSEARRRDLAEPPARYFESYLTIDAVARAYGDVLATVCRST